MENSELDKCQELVARLENCLCAIGYELSEAKALNCQRKLDELNKTLREVSHAFHNLPWSELNGLLRLGFVPGAHVTYSGTRYVLKGYSTGGRMLYARESDGCEMSCGIHTVWQAREMFEVEMMDEKEES